MSVFQYQAPYGFSDGWGLYPGERGAIGARAGFRSEVIDLLQSRKTNCHTRTRFLGHSANKRKKPTVACEGLEWLHCR